MSLRGSNNSEASTAVLDGIVPSCGGDTKAEQDLEPTPKKQSAENSHPRKRTKTEQTGSAEAGKTDHGTTGAAHSVVAWSLPFDNAIRLAHEDREDFNALIKFVGENLPSDDDPAILYWFHDLNADHFATVANAIIAAGGAPARTYLPTAPISLDSVKADILSFLNPLGGPAFGTAGMAPNTTTQYVNVCFQLARIEQDRFMQLVGAAAAAAGWPIPGSGLMSIGHITDGRSRPIVPAAISAPPAGQHQLFF
eukprot:287235-Rhodomonas_salina.1